MKTKVLALFYVDVDSKKGDSIRVRETVRLMNEVFSLQLICVNAASLGESVHSFHIPALRRGLFVVWNILSLLYGIYAGIRWKPQLIYADACPGSLSPAILSKLMRIPLVVEMHTPAGAQDVALYRATSRLRVTLAQWVEDITLSRASLVVASQGWANLVQQTQHIENDRLLILPLSVNRDVFKPMSQKTCRQTIGMPIIAPIAIFVGNIGPWQGLETLVEAAPLVLEKHPDAIFLIVGDGTMRSELIRQSRENNTIAAFRFVGPVAYEEVVTYIGASDVGLALFPGNRGHKGGVSAHKTLNYLACARPIIISEMDEMASLVEKYGAGRVVIPDDTSDLAEAMVWVFTKKHLEEYDLIQMQSEQIGRSLPTWRERIYKISSHIQEIVKDAD